MSVSASGAMRTPAISWERSFDGAGRQVLSASRIPLRSYSIVSGSSNSSADANSRAPWRIVRMDATFSRTV